VSADLEDISNLEMYIDSSEHILIFCSQGYFSSKNCMIELRSSVQKKKPILPLMELEMNKGGLTMEQIRGQLLMAREQYAKWSFPEDDFHGDRLYESLFASEQVEW